MKIFSALILLGLVAGGVFWERRASERLRAENETLRAEKQEADQLAAENRDLPRLRAAAPAPAPSGGNVELLRLRNQVRQLRVEQQEAAKLRAANQRAAEEIKSGKFTPRRLADVEGAVPREKWAFAGFASPEATVQSFFAAITSGDPEQFLRCAGPRTAERMRRDMARDPENFRKEFIEGLGKMGQVSAFRIVTTRPKGGDEGRMEVLVQVVADGAEMPLPLRRVDSEWKLDD